MNDIKNGILLLVLVAVLNSCTVSHDLPTPKSELPDRFRNERLKDSVGIGGLSWKLFYTDSLLRALIDTGLAHNYDMQVALNNIEAASVQLRQKNWSNIPETTLQISASTFDPSNNSLSGLSLNNFLGRKHIENYASALSISWEVDIWSKVKNEKRAALAVYLQTEEAKRGVQTRLIAAIAQGYYDLLTLDHQVDIAERNLKLNDSTLHLIRLQYDAGDVTIIGVQQAEAQRLVAAEIIPQLHQARLLQENALSVLIGSFPGAIHRADSLPSAMLSESFAAGLPAGMVSRRPDVKSQELALTIANAQVGIAKAQMYPSLSITATGGVEAFRFTNWFTVPASVFGTAAAGISQPILQRRRLKTQHEIALIERETTVLRFRQTVLTAVGEVSDALGQMEQLQRSAGVANERLNILKDAVPNAQLLFQNGGATYLEVVIAQSSLLRTELELANIKRAQLDARVELYRSLGGGWK